MAIDLKRRKAVMGRSVKLGHCVCNPRKPCPCDVFKQHNVCQCAGERLPLKSGDVALTRHVRKAGCASKIGQADLLRVLSSLPATEDPNVLVGVAAGDDAGVYRLDDGTCLVQTVDVFTPCVDDAYLFGQIAAANSVSDVYAMGGRPVCALSIIGFPIETLDSQVMVDMLRGGIDKLQEAGCPVVGGHSINDEEIKLGFAVTGLLESGDAVERAHAQVGDALVLTKALGTGMVAFAAQIGRTTQVCLQEVGASMATLNRDAAELMVQHGVHACTDVTGYGLAGHLVQMVRGGGVSAEIDLSQVPVFGAAIMCLENDILPGAIERNQQYAMAWVETPDGGKEGGLPILYDPQTSGGLLVALPAESAVAFVEAMRRRGHDATSVIGRVTERRSGREEGVVRITNATLRNVVGKQGSETMVASTQPVQPAATASGDVPSETSTACCESPASTPCCANPPGDQDENGTPAGDALAMFKDFMRAANSPGLIDSRTKKLMAIVLSISQHCRPCLETHLKTALHMGIAKEEVEEAANLAISFGGCTAMMFFREVWDDVCRQMT